MLVDIGNTRIKWATLERGRLVNRGSAVHRDSLDAASRRSPRRCRRSRASSRPTSRARPSPARLEALVAARPGASLELVATSAERFGVRCAYADPSRLGVDRWVAVLAAHHAARAAACVIERRHGRDVRRRRRRRRASRRLDLARAQGCSRPRSIATRATSGARRRRRPSRAGSSCSAATRMRPSATARGSRSPRRSIAPWRRSRARSARRPSSI